MRTQVIALLGLFLAWGGEVSTKHPGAIVLHGYTDGCIASQDAMQPIETALKRSGYVVVSPAMPDCPGTKAVDHVPEAVAAYDELVARNDVDANHIVVIGTSLGAHTAVLLTETRKVYAVVLHAPADYPDENQDMPLAIQIQDPDVHDQLVDWRKIPHQSSDTRLLRDLSAFNGRVLVGWSELDTDMVPRQATINVAHAAPHAEEIKISNAHHSLDEVQMNYWAKQIVSWLAESQEAKSAAIH